MVETQASITIPNRFESLAATFGNEIRPLIVPVEEDLGALLGLWERCKAQGGGLLAFMLGESGVGKTTAIHSAAVNHPDDFGGVLTVPPHIPLREVDHWLGDHLPEPNADLCTVVLFDGREVSDDTVGLKQFLTALNQRLRNRRDIVFAWPTTDPEWHSIASSTAKSIGGSNFAPTQGNHQVAGPPKTEWAPALDRLLLQFGMTVGDIGVAQDTVTEISQGSDTIGDFLTEIGALYAARVTQEREAKRLPRLLVCVSSSGDASGEANRIRRAGTQSLIAESLLGYSPKSEAGKWWTARNTNPLHHLGYMISLFDAKLVTMTASAVTHCCLQEGELDLKELAEAAGARPDSGNAKRTIEASEIYRLFTEKPVPEFTTGKKGSVSEKTLSAYAAIQAASAKRHKAINSAILTQLSGQVGKPDLTKAQLETNFGGDFIADATVPDGANTICVEFHHISGASCKAATMASYIMGKIRSYSLHHGLIPR